MTAGTQVVSSVPRTGYVGLSLIFSILALSLPLPAWTEPLQQEPQSEVKNNLSLPLYLSKATFNSFSLMSMMMSSLFYWSWAFKMKTWWWWRGLKEALWRPGRKAVPVLRPHGNWSEVGRGDQPCWRCWRGWRRRWTGSWKTTGVCLPSDLQVSRGPDWR